MSFYFDSVSKKMAYRKHSLRRKQNDSSFIYILVGIGIIVLLIVGGGIGYYLYKKKSSGTGTGTGGSTGGNTGGSTGGNTGGNTGNGSGTGSNTGGSTGGNTDLSFMNNINNISTKFFNSYQQVNNTFSQLLISSTYSVTPNFAYLVSMVSNNSSNLSYLTAYKYVHKDILTTGVSDNYGNSFNYNSTVYLIGTPNMTYDTSYFGDTSFYAISYSTFKNDNSIQTSYNNGNLICYKFQTCLDYKSSPGFSGTRITMYCTSLYVDPDKSNTNNLPVINNKNLVNSLELIKAIDAEVVDPNLAINLYLFFPTTINMTPDPVISGTITDENMTYLFNQNSIYEINFWISTNNNGILSIDNEYTYTNNSNIVSAFPMVRMRQQNFTDSYTKQFNLCYNKNVLSIAGNVIDSSKPSANINYSPLYVYTDGQNSLPDYQYPWAFTGFTMDLFKANTIPQMYYDAGKLVCYKFETCVSAPFSQGFAGTRITMYCSSSYKDPDLSKTQNLPPIYGPNKYIKSSSELLNLDTSVSSNLLCSIYMIIPAINAIIYS